MPRPWPDRAGYRPEPRKTESMSQIIEIPVGEGQERISALYAPSPHPMLQERERTLVVMAHGFPGSHKEAHRDLFGDMELAFGEFGFHTIRFDFRGCGKSEGREEKLTLSSAREDFAAILSWAERKGFEQFIYIGEGLGAAVCLQSLQENVRMLLLFWPVIDLSGHVHRHFQVDDQDNIPDSTGYITAGDHRIGLALIREMLETDLKPCLKGLSIPILAQHGAQDNIVPVEHLDILKNAVEARRVDITTYQDGNHGLTDARHRKMIFFHIGQFIEKYA